MTETQQLLAEYVETGSETAFRELTTRYLNLVYSTAFRLAGGDSHLAKDVVQTVFIQLAQNADKLSRESALGGWLHRTTCNVASKALRTERRRLERETQAMLMNAQSHETEARVEMVAPILDEAINQLGEEDRAAILLRFFEQRDFRAVGLALGSGEDAARMRVNRALEKLQGMLKRRGVVFSATALGTMLTTSAVSAAPAGLALTITGVAVAKVSTGGADFGIFNLMGQFKVGVAGAILVTGLAGTLILQNQSKMRLEGENASLKKLTAAQQEEMESLRRRLPRKEMASSLTDQERTDLLRLRGEMGFMKKQLADSEEKQAEIRKLLSHFADSFHEEALKNEKEFLKERLEAAMEWMKAFHLFAEKNSDKFPASFEEAKTKLGPFNRDKFVSLVNDFELYRSVALSEVKSPQHMVIIRSKAMPLISGGWARAYGYADGHAEVLRSSTAEFLSVEKDRGLIYPEGATLGQ